MKDFAGLPLDKPLLMGIVNVTPDSFSDGGQFSNTQNAIDHALRLEDEGANILDIGGESTRPGSETVSVSDELKRVLPVIEALKNRASAKLSIDTRKAEVMQNAHQCGANIVNDVSALSYDPESLAFVAKSQLPVILMHAQGDPKTMQNNPVYENVISELIDYFNERIKTCLTAGILKENIALDPGIGFGKTLEHNIQIFSKLEKLRELGCPILMGTSRKSFIGMISGEKDPQKRLAGSIASVLWSLEKGANIFRVHDVSETRQAIEVWNACKY